MRRTPFFKFVGAAVLLLVVGMQAKTNIEASYSMAQCQHCYDESLTHPNLLYEFGYCSIKLHPGKVQHQTPNVSSGWMNQKNLLKEPSKYGDTPPTSRVSSYVLNTAIVLGGGFIIACLAGLPAFSGDFDMSHLLAVTMYASILYMGFLMFVSNRVFELYQDASGCYISALPVQYHLCEYIIWTVYIIVVFLGCCFGLLTDTCGTFCICTAYVVMIVYSFYSLVAGVRNLMETDRPWHFLFNLLAFLSTWEIPFVFSGLAGLFICFGFRASQNGGGVETSQLRGLISGVMRSDNEPAETNVPPHINPRDYSEPEIGAFENERGISTTTTTPTTTTTTTSNERHIL